LGLSGVIVFSLGDTFLGYAFEGKTGATLTTLREKPQVIRLITRGALAGLVLGVSSSLLAVQHSEIVVTSTLMLCTKSHTFFCRYFP